MSVTTYVGNGTLPGSRAQGALPPGVASFHPERAASQRSDSQGNNSEFGGNATFALTLHADG